MANSLATQVDAWGLTGVAPSPLGLLSRFDLTGSSKIESTGSVGAIDWTDCITAATAVRDSNFESGACLSPKSHDFGDNKKASLRPARSPEDTEFRHFGALMPPGMLALEIKSG